MGRVTRNKSDANAPAAATKSTKRPSSATTANMPSAISQTRYLAEKNLKDSCDEVRAVPTRVFETAEQQLEQKSVFCKEAMKEASHVIASHDKTYEGQKSALGQLDLVMKGLEVKIKLLDSKKLEQFCKSSSDSLKTDVSHEYKILHFTRLLTVICFNLILLILLFVAPQGTWQGLN